MSKKEKGLGQFLSDLAQNANEASSTTLMEMKAAAVKEQQDQIKAQVTTIYRGIQSQVAELKIIRQREASVLHEIKRLEAFANDIVSGKAVLEPASNVVRVRVSSGESLGDVLRSQLAVKRGY